MIKASELRIGNYIIDPKDGSEKKVNIFQLGKSMIDDVNIGYIPIPLTPEILEKCGFESKGHSTYWHINPDLSYVFKISHVGNGKWFSINATANKPIQYLHELQNLYFALTGEELEIAF